MAGPGDLLASRVSSYKEERTFKKIPVGAILTVAMQAVFEGGPLGSERTQLVFGEADAKQKYRGHFADGLSALVIETFFKEAPGARMRLSRVVHYADVSDPTTKTSAAATTTIQTEPLGATNGFVLGTIEEPFALADGDTLDVSVDGGGTLTATFNAAAATRTAGNPETYNLSAGGETLTVSINGGPVQTVTFQTSNFAVPAAATAAEVAAVMNAQLTACSVDVDVNAPRITTDRLGTGAGVNVTGGSANAVLGFVTGNIPGTGDAADAGAVTVAELVTLITGDIAGVTPTDAAGYLRIETDTPGTGGSIQVEASSSMDDELGLDNATHTGTDAGAVDTAKITIAWDGARGNDFYPVISEATSGAADQFRLQMYLDGALVQEDSWDNVSMVQGRDDYAPTKINATFQNGTQLSGSFNIVFEDLFAAVASPDNRPAIGTHGPMIGGDDGLVGLTDADYNGGVGPNGRTGLRTFDKDSDIQVLISPDRATSSHHNAMVTYCDVFREGKLFAVLDCPEGYSAEAMAVYVSTTASLFELTEQASIRWPRGKVTNPAPGIYGPDKLITIPTSGAEAGVMARTDASKIGGVWEQPAGLPPARLPRSIEELETDEVKDEAKRKLLFPLNVNLLSQESDGPIFFDGARVLDISGNWPSIGASRGAIFTRLRIEPALGPLRHQNLRDDLYNSGLMTIEEFMDSFTAAAKGGSDAFEDYSADLGPELNPARVKAQRLIRARVGIKRWEIGEFVNVAIGLDSEQLQAQFEGA